MQEAIDGGYEHFVSENNPDLLEDLKYFKEIYQDNPNIKYYLVDKEPRYVYEIEDDIRETIIEAVLHTYSDLVSGDANIDDIESDLGTLDVHDLTNEINKILDRYPYYMVTKTELTL